MFACQEKELSRLKEFILNKKPHVIAVSSESRLTLNSTVFESFAVKILNQNQYMYGNYVITLVGIAFKRHKLLK